MLAMVAFGITITTAQEISENAIGLRLGSNDGIGIEASYQRKFGDNNRIEADLGYRIRDKHDYDYSIVKLTGTYQWVWQISDTDFNWYAGAGGGVVHTSWDTDNNGGDDSETNLLAAGVVGVEYLFPNLPIQVSVDYRPELYFGSDANDGLGNDIAVSARYRF